MFTNKEVKCDNFDVDSSKEAWEHYRKYYIEHNEGYSIRKNFNFDHLFLYNRCEDVGLKEGYKGDETNGECYNYTNDLKKGVNRYYALDNSVRPVKYKGHEYSLAASRLGGDCDFNFNEKQYRPFKTIIGDNQKAIEQLNRCEKMHHTLLNFSLIQAMGNMQGFKGSNEYDRCDTFIYELDRYFKGDSDNILSKSTAPNRPDLINYLEHFKNIYEYCKEIYFIESHEFVDRIIKNGERPIRDCDDVVRYMNLAEEFWAEKEFYFLKKEFLTVGEYFHDGGEIYTLEELLMKIENDSGYSAYDGKELIEKCIERGFIIDCGNNSYTR